MRQTDAHLECESRLVGCVDTQRIVSDRVSVVPITGCWMWMSYLNKHLYSRITIKSRNYTGHRISYLAFRGPIPRGMELDHLCRNRWCCNPDHLEIVTSKENTMRGTSFAAVNAARTTCKAGHTFDMTRRGKHVQRGCRTCRRAAVARYDRKRRLAALLAKHPETP